MARPRRRALQPSDIEGLEYFDTLVPLLARLKDIGTQRDRAGNRQLFYDQYVCLLLLYFFSPTITSLRLCSRLRPWRPFNDDWGFGRRRWAPLAKPRGCLTPRPCTKSSRNWRPRPRRWSMDPTAPVARSHRRRRQYLRAFPRMAWALWKDSEHRGVKLHLHFDVFCGTPLDASITHASGSETDQLRAMLRPGRLYVIDRGYYPGE